MQYIVDTMFQELIAQGQKFTNRANRKIKDDDDDDDDDDEFFLWYG